MASKKRTHSEISEPVEAEGNQILFIRGVPEGDEDKIRAMVEFYATVESVESVQEHQKNGEINEGKKQVTIEISSDKNSAHAAANALRSAKKLGEFIVHVMRQNYTPNEPSETIVVKIPSEVSEEDAKAEFPTAKIVDVRASYEWYLVRATYDTVDQAKAALAEFSGSFGDVAAISSGYQDAKKPAEKKQKTSEYRGSAPRGRGSAPRGRGSAPRGRGAPRGRFPGQGRTTAPRGSSYPPRGDAPKTAASPAPKTAAAPKTEATPVIKKDTPVKKETPKKVATPKKAVATPTKKATKN